MQTTYQTAYDLAWPTDWVALFGADRPLIVEIGFGNADYLIALGQQYPDHHIIGLEISHISTDKAVRKMKNNGLSNILPILSRAETALHHLFQPQQVQQFHINYPDPWFKNRHSGRRLMQRDTLDAIVSRLQVGGLLYLATDIAAYAEMSDALLRETPQLDNRLDAAWVNQLPERLITTKYEQKGYREGRPGHFFVYERNAQPAPPVPVIEELPMPHAVLETPLAPDAILEAFDGRTEFNTGDGIHVTLIDGFWNPRRESLLFEVHIEEPTIDQHVGLLVLPKRDESNRYTVKYAALGMPRATLGMHRAVNTLADWVAGLHADGVVISRKLRLR